MVPNGWNLGLFGDGIELISGQHVEAKFVNTVGNGKPYLTGPADFPKGKVIVTKYTKQAKKECVAGDLLITVKGSGTGKVIEADSDYAISRQLMAIRAKKFDSKFCYYNLVSNIKRYEDAAAGLIPGISREDVLNTPLMIPPLPEQRKIAQILSTWDRGIATTEKLIDASKQQKKALMQQLLTGKKRLVDPETGKAFEGKWEEECLSRLTTIITNGFVGTATPFYTDDSGIPYLYGLNVKNNKLNKKGLRYVTREFHKKQIKSQLIEGDLLMVQSGHIGETAVVTKEFENSNCHALIIIKPKRNLIYPNYLSCYFNSEYGKYRLMSLEVGSTIMHINTKDMKKFSIPLPALKEQQKIASVLTATDKDIELLEAKLAHFKQEKKALMQQLLTGKRRVSLSS
ncbi:restriction endonuclease subunit S [Photobacterium carnosum]|uniref:restriction endonuclease subunit S n=1 Tax=Photobacterium carnosum TaxID=2023717 RepID=UPI001E2FBE1E|nr:restriction endonuclease subunit S [Photobacterium carnosum]MCD9514195.1 restriction endonuclease subunit S [Photobacterium carnosum]